MFHVLAVFERVCDLVSLDEQGRRRVVALVTPEIGDGPLNIVLEESNQDFSAIEPGTRARLDGEQLQLDAFAIDLGEAQVWDPRPDWPSLRACRAAIEGRLAALSELPTEHALRGSFFSRRDEVPYENRDGEALIAVGRSAAFALEEGWAGDLVRLEEGAAQLAGLGPGLTPSGDDTLCGVMLWAWLAHPHPERFCRAVVETAASRTTTLSAAFLRAAARGECGSAWHALLNALAEGDDAAWRRAAGRVLSRGATSGADAITGFVWLALQP